jgi:hypothetical protein
MSDRALKPKYSAFHTERMEAGDTVMIARDDQRFFAVANIEFEFYSSTREDERRQAVAGSGTI